MARAGRKGAAALSRALPAMQRAAARARRRRVRALALLYDRGRDLPRLVPLLPALAALPEPALTRAIIGRLKRALRLSLALRARRDWSYCRHRHTALLAALARERVRLRCLQSMRLRLLCD